MENEILKDCPFCGSFEVEYTCYYVHPLYGCDHYIKCSNCDSKGPSCDCDNEQDAITLWEERK